MQELNEKLVRNGWTGKNGLYVSVIPTPKSKTAIRMIAGILNTACNDDLHCTVMYSPDHAPKELSLLPRTKAFKAKIKDIEVFGKDKALVITLDSPDLQAEHKRLKKLGAKHTFDPYVPHVTINVNQPWERDFMDKMKTQIAGKELVFHDYSWDDIAD